MQRTMEFYEAVRKEIIKKGDFINPEKIFRNEQIEITVDSDLTGVNKRQIFKREKLNWIFSTDEDERFALFGNSTKTKLSLCGKIGSENGLEALEKITSLYSNPYIGMKAKNATEDDICILKDGSISEEVLEKLFSKSGWIESCFSKVDIVSDCCYVGMLSVNHSETINVEFMYFSNERKFKGSFGICPVILIPQSKVYVDLKSMKKHGEWKLFLRNNKCL